VLVLFNALPLTVLSLPSVRDEISVLAVSFLGSKDEGVPMVAFYLFDCGAVKDYCVANY
jgi:hypothetical protein